MAESRPGVLATIAATPGRLEVIREGWSPPPKPSADEVPWRSGCYVSRRHSADGNGYRRGEPIPEAEARRQGLIVIEPVPRRRPKLATCPRCHGRRVHTLPRPKGHLEGCGCRFCGPCPRCAGSGYVPA